MNTLRKGEERNLRLESVYGAIEAAFGVALTKLLSGAPPDNDAIEAVIAFVAAQFVRTPKFRRGWTFSPDSRNEGELAAIVDPDLRSAAGELISTVLNNSQPLLSFQSLPQVLRLISDRRMVFVKTDGPASFATSDSPCCVVQYKERAAPVLACLESPTANILMPLHPNLAVVLDRSAKPHEMIGGFRNRTIINEMNSIFWRGADEWVVLPGELPDEEWFSNFVAGRLSQYVVL